MGLLGLDVYGGNSATKVIAAIALEKWAFTIAKATEGMTVKDSQHAQNRLRCEQNGDTFGSYTFCWPSNDPVAAMKFFLDTAQPKVGELVALDLENWGGKNAQGVWPYMVGYGWDVRWRYAMQAVAYLHDQGIAKPLIYLNWDWLKNFRTVATVADWEWFIDNPLWLAQWQMGGVQTQPGVFDYAAPKAGGTKEWHPTFHQYISGSTSATGLDEDWFVGATKVDLLPYTIQSEDELTMAQFEDIMGRLGDITTALTLIKQDIQRVEGIATTTQTAVNETKVNLTNTHDDLEATSRRVIEVQDAVNTPVDYSAVLTKVEEVETRIGDLATPLDAIKTAVESMGDPAARIDPAVKAALSGFSINMQFPQNG